MQEKEWLEVLEKDHEMVNRLVFADWLEERNRDVEAFYWRKMVKENYQPADVRGYPPTSEYGNTFLSWAWFKHDRHLTCDYEIYLINQKIPYQDAILFDDVFEQIRPLWESPSERKKRFPERELGKAIPGTAVAFDFVTRLEAEQALVYAWIALEGKEVNV